jgi:sulfur carrier protein
MLRPTETATSPATITVNGQPHRVPDATSLAELLARLGHAADSLATAVNGEFVARGQREQRVLRAGDQVTCFQPIVGG